MLTKPHGFCSFSFILLVFVVHFADNGILRLRYKCEAQDELEAAAHYHLTWILLCLENAAHNAKVRLILRL